LRAAVAAVGALALLGVAGCSSGDGDAQSSTVRDTSTNVPFTACTPEACSGNLDGFQFEIVMPARWNGTLLMYSPDSPERDTSGASTASVSEVAPGWAAQSRAVADALAGQGYALAGLSTPGTGWPVDAQVAAMGKLRDHFQSSIGRPNRVYTWGQGVGAASSVVAAEQQEWVSGSAPMCGLLAGVNPNYDLALDAAYLVKSLLYRKMKLTNFASAAEATKTYREAMAAVRKAAADVYGPGGMQLAVIAAAGEIPTKNAANSGSGMRGKSVTVPEALAAILARSTIGRFEIEQQFGGNPSTNVGTDYSARVTASEREVLAIFDKKSVDRYLAIAARGQRVAADPAAREAAAKSGSPTGQVRVPTVTLHTEYDARAIVQNESMLAISAARAGADQSRMLKINVTSPPSSYPEKGPVTYGAGHCNFTPQSILGTITIVNDMVRDDIYPTAVNTARLLGVESGYNPDYRLRQWPAGPDRPATAAPPGGAESPAADGSPAPESE